jgi:hypothetical protein
MAEVEAGAYHRRNFISNASEQLTIDGTVGGKALTAGTYGTNRYATITVADAEIMFTTSGAAPTATFGHRVGPKDVIRLESNEDIVKFRAIRTSGTDAKIFVTYQEIKLTS